MNKGQRIKKAREEMGISQTELATRIGVSKQNMYKYENSIITNIPSDKIEAIANICEITPSYIMGWDDDVLPTEETDDKTIEMTPTEKETIELYLKLNPIAKEKIDEAVRQAIFAQVLAE